MGEKKEHGSVTVQRCKREGLVFKEDHSICLEFIVFRRARSPSMMCMHKHTESYYVLSRTYIRTLKKYIYMVCIYRYIFICIIYNAIKHKLTRTHTHRYTLAHTTRRTRIRVRVHACTCICTYSIHICTA